MKIHFGYFFQDISYPVSILASLAKKKGCDVELCPYASKDTENKIRKRIKNSKPDLVALSFMLYSRDQAFLVARIAQELGIKVVAGGVHASSCPDDLKKSGYFDGIVLGDGLGIFNQIIEGYKDLYGHVIRGRSAKRDALYFTRYFTKAQERRIKKSKTFEIFTSFGCPFSCAFCASKTTLGYKRFAPELVAETLEGAKNRFGLQDIFVWDDTFTTSLRWIQKFRRGLEKRGLSFRFSVQARTSNFTHEMAGELARLGVYEATFGIETASERLLKFLNKNATLEDAYRTKDLCEKHGMAFHVFLMVGLPTQTRADYECTLDLVRETSPARVYVSYFVPFPGTRLFRYCIKHGHMPENWTFERYLERELNDPVAKGKRIFGGLKGIDYDMAAHYHEKFESLVPTIENDAPKNVEVSPFSKAERISQEEIRQTLLRI